MVVVPTLLKFYLSGGAGNTDKNLSLGGVRSTTEITQQQAASPSPAMRTLFNDFSKNDRTNGKTKFRCIYLRNEGAQTLTNIKLWMSQATPADDSVRFAYSGLAANSTEQSIVDLVQDRFYNVPNAGDSWRHLDNTNDRGGIKIAGADAPLVGKICNKIDVRMRKVGTPTGTLSVNCRNNADTVRYGLGTLDVSTLTTTEAVKTFTGNGSNLAFAHEDKLNFEYAGGSASNYVQLKVYTPDTVLGVHFVRRSGGQYFNQGNTDVIGAIYDTTTFGGESTEPTGIVFQDPRNEATAISLPSLTTNSFVGIWLKAHCPKGIGHYLKNFVEWRVDYDSPT